jgi:hypothetical protein
MVSNASRRRPGYPTNEPLLKAITALSAQQHNPEAWRAFYAALLNSTLLLARETDIDRPVLYDDNAGSVVLPVFTDLGRLQTVLPDITEVATLSARDLCQIALQNDIPRININPQRGPGGFLNRAQMEALALGQIPALPDDNPSPLKDEATLVPFGSPELPSEEVIEEMLVQARKLMAEESQIEEAYLILMRRDEHNSLLTVGLRFTDEASEAPKSAFTQRFVPAIEAVIHQPLHVLWLKDEDVQDIRINVDPFYVRGRFDSADAGN